MGGCILQFSTIFPRIAQGKLSWIFNLEEKNNRLLIRDLLHCPFRKANVFVFGHQWKPSLGKYK
jgi:hypothetical protein